MVVDKQLVRRFREWLGLLRGAHELFGSENSKILKISKNLKKKYIYNLETPSTAAVIVSLLILLSINCSRDFLEIVELSLKNNSKYST